MRTLITGFGPFGHVTDNPSARLAEDSGRDFEILEVSYEGVETVLARLDPERFDTLLLLGVAVERKGMTPEFHARNWRGPNPDAKGQRSEGLIEEGAPMLIQSTLWNAHLLASLQFDLNLWTSFDAGDYLCNYTYYRALQLFPQKQVGFLHIPPFEKVPQKQQMTTLSEILTQIEISSQGLFTALPLPCSVEHSQGQLQNKRKMVETFLLKKMKYIATELEDKDDSNLL